MLGNVIAAGVILALHIVYCVALGAWLMRKEREEKGKDEVGEGKRVKGEWW